MFENKLSRLLTGLKNREAILLESQLKEHPSSVRSYLAIGDEAKIVVKNRKAIFFEDGREIRRVNGEPWKALKKFRREYPGWHFGYLGYNLGNQAESEKPNSEGSSGIPDMIFLKPRLLAEIKGDVMEWIYGDGSELKLNSTSSDQNRLGPFVDRFIPGVSKERYLQKVEDIRQRIKEGDFYELNFSYPLTGRFEGNPLQLYEQMKQVNPVPFGAYLAVEGMHVCCASPERFLKKSGAKLLSEPIKGTSARAEDPSVDQKNRDELLNEKNRAENLMIVDLVRHDLAKIAKTGTVKVDKLFDLQSFGTVHQLISSISCEVDNRLDPVDYIQECFPMGSMTGAPKIEVMKHIDRLEEYSRGIYSGAIGYFTPEGDFDFNVVIRTAIIRDGVLTYPVGGAITSDSIPAEEWEETLLKAKSLFRALPEESGAEQKA